MPAPPRLAVSQVEHVSPAAPMSWIPTTRPGTAIISRHASIRSFSMNGSPLFTAGRAAASAPPRGGADVVDGISKARGLSAPDLVVAKRSEAERVHQGVALV